MSPCTKSLLLRKTTITAAERAIYMLKRGNYPNPNLVTNKPKQASSCYPFFCWGFTLFNAGCHPVKNKFPWHKSIFSLEETFGELEDITGQWCSRHKCTLIDWTQSMLHRRPPFLKTWVKRQPCKQLFVMVALQMKQNTKVCQIVVVCRAEVMLLYQSPSSLCHLRVPIGSTNATGRKALEGM